MCIGLKSGEPFWMAGLWDEWRSPDGTVVDSVTVITTDANALIAPIHDRMPAILRPDNVESWITAEYDPDLLQSMLKPFDAGKMAAENIALSSEERDEAQQLTIF